MIRTEEAALRYRFGDFVLDVGDQRLSRIGGESATLTGKPYDVLRYLVEHAGQALSKEVLLQAVWPNTVVEENSLTQVISGLRQLLGEVPGDNRYIVTIPRKGYRFVSAVETIAVPGTSMAAAGGGTARNRTRLFRFGILGVLIIVAAAAAHTVWRRNHESAGSSSIAILPFKPVIATDGDPALELGMTDSLIAHVGQRADRVVAPLSSVRRYSALDQDPVAAGHSLHVDLVLDGSLQRAGERLRVSVRLLRVADGRQLWSQTFDQAFTGIFEVQEQIAARIASALALQSLGSGPALGGDGTQDPEAYSLYTRGRFAFLKLTDSDLQQAINFYEQAVFRDPQYARAYAGLADAYSLLGVLGMRDPRIVFPHARTAIGRALQLAPDLPDAYVSRAQLRGIYDRDRRAALEDLNHATALNPRLGSAYFYRGLIYGSQGHFAESQAEFDHAEALEPSVLARPAAAALQLMYARRYVEAAASLRRILVIDPRFDLARGFLIRTLLAQGDAAGALAEIRAHPLHAQGSYGFFATALALSGRRDEARLELERVVQLSQQQYVPAYDIAIAFGALQDGDTTLHWLWRAYDDRSTLLGAMSQEPLLQFLKDDPRFVEFIGRTETEHGL